MDTNLSVKKSKKKSFKARYNHLEHDWADRVWDGVCGINNGNGAAWKLAVAALAVTGVRPVSLERGIEFSWYKDPAGYTYIRAKIHGAKLLYNSDGSILRGQEQIGLEWCVTRTDTRAPDLPEREREFRAIFDALSVEHPDRKEGSIVIQYGAKSIATKLEQLSKSIWPRKKQHVFPVAYRERFAAVGKALGIDRAELAAAMGHLSTESQGKYKAPPRGKASSGGFGPQKLFGRAVATNQVKQHRSPMDRFKKRNVAKMKQKP